jgi:hypothetical protein
MLVIVRYATCRLVYGAGPQLLVANSWSADMGLECRCGASTATRCSKFVVGSRTFVALKIDSVLSSFPIPVFSCTVPARDEAIADPYRHTHPEVRTLLRINSS